MATQTKKTPRKRGRKGDFCATHPLYFCTPVREDTRHGRELQIFLRPELMDEIGLEPGCRISIEVTAADGVGTISKAAQFGWVIRPCRPGNPVYCTRLAWTPKSGFPLVKQSTALPIALKEPSKSSIIFELPNL